VHWALDAPGGAVTAIADGCALSWPLLYLVRRRSLQVLLPQLPQLQPPFAVVAQSWCRFNTQFRNSAMPQWRATQLLTTHYLLPISETSRDGLHHLQGVFQVT
jgi:hypothetical protein